MIIYETSQAIVQWTSESDLVQSTSALNCGTYSITWHESFNGGTQAELAQSSVFNAATTTSINAYSSDTAAIGTYTLSYTVEIVDSLS